VIARHRKTKISPRRHGDTEEIAKIARIAKIAEIETRTYRGSTRISADQQRSGDLVIARDRVIGKQGKIEAKR